MWQDSVFAIGAIIFSIALIPTIRGPEKPPLITSLPTALTLFVFSFTFVSLQLWFSAAMQFIAASLWAILAIQQYTKHKR